MCENSDGAPLKLRLNGAPSGSIRWRDGYYYIRNGELVPVDPAAALRAAEKAPERV